MTRKFLVNDIFKIIILIGLGIWLATLMNEPIPNVVEKSESPLLPPFPDFTFRLHYDTELQQLVDEVNSAYFVLDTESGVWQPLIQGEISALLFDQQAMLLRDEYGNAIYQTRKPGEGWVPTIPVDIAGNLPQNYVMNQDESMVWLIRDMQGTTLYSFNEGGKTWMLPEPNTSADFASTEVDFCPLANPTRISGKGIRVRVINAIIPLRASPAVLDDNFLGKLEPGVELVILDGPVCEPYLDGANLWWRVSDENGREGWVAEASAISQAYYLECLD